MFGTKSAKRISFASAYLPKRQQHNVAGFLTRFQNCAFPSSDSGFLQFQLKKLTAAGTVQDSHLFPSQDFYPSPPCGGKDTFFLENTII